MEKSTADDILQCKLTAQLVAAEQKLLQIAQTPQLCGDKTCKTSAAGATIMKGSFSTLVVKLV